MPNVTVTRDITDGLGAIAEHFPSAYTALRRSWATIQAAVDDTLLATLVSRTDSLFSGSAAASASTPQEFADILAFADQYVDYVPDIDDELRDPLQKSLSRRQLRDITDALYVIDQAARLRVAHRQLGLADGAPPSDTAQLHDQPDKEGKLESIPARANMEWHDVILTVNPLGSLTRELVRLRAGRYHQCGVCNSMRLIEDGTRVVSCELEQALNSNEDTALLSDSQKAALRYADMHMADPGGISSEIRDDLNMHFTREQIIQLTLEVSSWNYQKVLVALAIDKPADSSGIVAMTINDHGSCIPGELLV